MRVLVIAAHMDDETLGPGAAVVRHAEAGDEVLACIVCQRAYDHQYDDAANAVERAACERACGILGYRGVRHLMLRDELLDERLLDVIVPVEDVVGSFGPDVVYTHHRGDANQDHRAVFHASMVACRPHARHRVARVLSYEVPSSTDQAAPVPEFAFLPNFYVDVTRQLSRKQQALAAYVRELREFPHPRSVKGLEVLAQKRGMEVGCAAAEAFLCLRDVWR